MKSRRNYLHSIWTPVVIMVIVNLILWFHSYLHLENNCGYSDLRAISPKQGNLEAVVQRECCDRGCTERVVLRSGQLDTKVFVYELGSHGPDMPVIVWVSPEELNITVDRISHIYSQLREANGVKITYQVGSVDDP
jgi:hypothetical protein